MNHRKNDRAKKVDTGSLYGGDLVGKVSRGFVRYDRHFG